MKVFVLEYWHKVPKSIMALKDKERRIEAIKKDLMRLDPELKFVKLDGNICLAVKESEPNGQH